MYENFQGNKKCYHHTCNMKENKNGYHNTVCKTKLITYSYTYYHKERKLQTEWRKRIGCGDGNWAVRDSNAQPNEYFFQQIKFPHEMKNSSCYQRSIKAFKVNIQVQSSKLKLMKHSSPSLVQRHITSRQVTNPTFTSMTLSDIIPLQTLKVSMY